MVKIDLLDPSQILNFIWKEKRNISSVFASLFLLGFLSIFLIDKEYEAKIIIGKNTKNITNLASGGSLSSIASLVGADFDTSLDNSFQKFEERIISEKISEYFINQTLVKHYFFKSFYDQEGFLKKKNLSRSLKEILLWPFGYKELIPNGFTLMSKIDKEISVTKDAKTNFLTIQFHHKDREFAAQFLLDLVSYTDETIRKDSETYSLNKINYLNEILLEIKNISLLESISQRIAAEQEILANVKADEFYSFEVIEDLTLSDQPMKPNILTFLIALTFLSFISSFILMLLLKKEH